RKAIMRQDHMERGLQNLLREFPLQSRVMNEPEPVQKIYAEIIRFWVLHAHPPLAQNFPEIPLQRLRMLDAVAISPEGLIGAYPFSAKETPIRVSNGKHQSIFAMCAIDALAIPFLWNAPIEIESACHDCAVAIKWGLDPNGDSPDIIGAPYVAMGHLDGKTCAEQPACSGLCTGIYFLCTACARNLTMAIYPLQEAQYISQMFFGFQVALLQKFQYLQGDLP
ncbi:organomercurial lyase, partial [Acidithiobacillus thiooxidans]